MAQHVDSPALLLVAGVFAVACFGTRALVVVAPLIALLIWPYVHGIWAYLHWDP